MEQWTKELKHIVSLVFVSVRRGCHMSIRIIATVGTVSLELNLTNDKAYKYAKYSVT